MLRDKLKSQRTIYLLEEDLQDVRKEGERVNPWLKQAGSPTKKEKKKKKKKKCIKETLYSINN